MTYLALCLISLSELDLIARTNRAVSALAPFGSYSRMMTLNVLHCNWSRTSIWMASRISWVSALESFSLTTLVIWTEFVVVFDEIVRATHVMFPSTQLLQLRVAETFGSEQYCIAHVLSQHPSARVLFLPGRQRWRECRGQPTRQCDFLRPFHAKQGLCHPGCR